MPVARGSENTLIRGCFGFPKPLYYLHTQFYPEAWIFAHNSMLERLKDFLSADLGRENLGDKSG